MKKINKIINITLSLSVILLAFFSVFGNVFQKLNTDKQVNNSVTESKTQNTNKVSTDQKQTVPNTEQSSPKTNTYNMTQVSTHNSAQTCWSAINGEVYDLTSWVSRHPGGKVAILMICGKDGSSLFNTQHGGSNRAQSILNSFKIGTLNG